MIDTSKAEAFVAALNEVVTRHGLTFSACGCCGGISIFENDGRPLVVEEDRWREDDLFIRLEGQ